MKFPLLRRKSTKLIDGFFEKEDLHIPVKVFIGNNLSPLLEGITILNPNARISDPIFGVHPTFGVAYKSMCESCTNHVISSSPFVNPSVTGYFIVSPKLLDSLTRNVNHWEKAKGFRTLELRFVEGWIPLHIGISKEKSLELTQLYDETYGRWRFLQKYIQ